MARLAFIALLWGPAQIMAQSSHLSGSFGAGINWMSGIGSELSNRQLGRTIVGGARYAIQPSTRYALSVGFEYAVDRQTFTTPGTPTALPESSHFYRHTLHLDLLQAPIGLDYFFSPTSWFSMSAAGVPGFVLSAEREIDEVISTMGPNAGNIIAQDNGEGAITTRVFLKYAIGVSGRFSIGSSRFRLSIQHTIDLLPLAYLSADAIDFPGNRMKRSSLEMRIEMMLWRWTR